MLNLENKDSKIASNILDNFNERREKSGKMK